jgi:two-component system, NtrC family, sensor kinase
MNTALSSLYYMIFVFIIVTILGIILASFVGIIFAYNFTKPIDALATIASEFSAGNYTNKAKESGLREFMILAQSFNKMTGQLVSLNQNLEEKVNQRTKELEKSKEEIENRNSELERINKFMVGRELQMVKLKEEIERLKSSETTTHGS